VGIQETVRRQEEQLAAQAKQQPQKQQPVAQAQPAAVDLHAFRQIVEDVVHAQLQIIRAEQPPQQGPQPIDMQALQQAMHSVVRAELQIVQTTLTLLVQAIQAQTDALMGDDDVDQEQDDLLPTAPSHCTDDDEDLEGEQVYPPNEDEDEGIDEEGEPDEDEGEGGGGGGESYPRNPLRPESPTHRLRRPGPVGIHLGGNTAHSSQGTRRWEPSYEQ